MFVKAGMRPGKTQRSLKLRALLGSSVHVASPRRGSHFRADRLPLDAASAASYSISS